MVCKFCGRPIKSTESIKHQAGHRCYMRDKQQLKLDLAIDKKEEEKRNDGKKDTTPHD